MNVFQPKIIATAAVLFSLGLVQLGATSIVIPVLADAEIRSGSSASTPVGGETATIFVGTIDAGRKSRSLLSFDLSSLPANATITSVKLVMDAASDASSPDTLKTVNLHQLTQSFDEATVTFNSRSTGSDWTTAGGTFAPTVLASTQVSTRGGVDFTWESSALTAFVQAQYSSQSVVSFLLKGTDANELLTSRELVRFFASENLNTSFAGPRLLIEFSTSSIPEPSTYGLLLGMVGLTAAVTLRRPSRGGKHGA